MQRVGKDYSSLNPCLDSARVAACLLVARADLHPRIRDIAESNQGAQKKWYFYFFPYEVVRRAGDGGIGIVVAGLRGDAHFHVGDEGLATAAAQRVAQQHCDAQ